MNDSLQLQILREVMTTVNNVVLTQLMIMQLIVDELATGKPLSSRHLTILDRAIAEIALHLRSISATDAYETEMIVEGIHALKYLLLANPDRED